MTPRNRSSKEEPPSLPPIPENTEAKYRSSQWNDDDDDDHVNNNDGDEDAEDMEEQGLYEKDNDVNNLREEENAIPSNDAARVNNHFRNKVGFGNNQGSNNDRSNDGDDIDNTASIESRRLDPGPFYVQSSVGDKWELTWPIWHMLPRNERRAIAAQHGMKSIGEFEEYMSLTRAVDESEMGMGIVGEGSLAAGSVGRERAAVEATGARTNGEEEDQVTSLASRLAGTSLDKGVDQFNRPGTLIEDEIDDSSVSSSEEDSAIAKSSDPTKDNQDNDLKNHLEAILRGGLPCILPDEILHKCFSYLPIDDHATLALVSPHWSRFTRCESLYKRLCQRIYLNQSKRKAMHVSRFGNSYRKMLQVRPRVRTGGGLYVLQYREVRKIQRDMWTEIPVGAILESIYYRYLYFFEDGRVMYALTHATPVEMIPRFMKMLIHGHESKDKWGVWGKYQLEKDVVRVWASHEWHDVCFQLRVIASNKVLQYDNGERGMFTTMALEKHMSSVSGNFEDESHDLVTYDIPSQCYFRFLRDRRL